MLAKRLFFCSASASLVATGLAHGHGLNDGEDAPVVAAEADWVTRHMAEEHGIGEFDSSSFFTLHDYNEDGQWSPSEILRTYGLFDQSNADVSEARRREVVERVLALFDVDSDGQVSRDEWVQSRQAGKTLPDMGTGPGHHGDDEYEYEIHHWDKFHDENTKLEDLTHPEDIEHFRKHEEMDAEQARLAEREKQSIIDENIPDKFRRASS